MGMVLFKHGFRWLYPLHHSLGVMWFYESRRCKKNRRSSFNQGSIKNKTKPKLLSDNGLCYVSNELKTYLKDQLKMKQVHGKPMHPETQGKIEQYHRTMKNVVKLNHFIFIIQKN